MPTSAESKQQGKNEANIQTLQEDMKVIKALVVDMKKTLDELTGTKKFLVWLTATLGLVAGIIISYLTFKNRGN